MGDDGGWFTTLPPLRLEARSRLGDKAANELGAPVVSSIPAQLPGPEPASARKDERMIEQCFGEIDVSQDRLDVLLLRRAQASRSPTTRQAGAR